MIANNSIYYPSLASLFTSAFINKLIKNTHVEFLKETLEFNCIKDLQSGESVRDILSDIFFLLTKNYRCEYIFKTAVLNNLILKRHSLSESTYLPEFRAGSSKADMVILNGTSTVYEIKSDIDSIKRLESQMSSYEKVFDKVYAVVSPEHLSDTLKILNDKIGLIVVDKNLKLTTIRSAESNIYNLDKGMVFDSLRKNEYIQIIKSVYGSVPDVPNTHIYNDCKDLFIKIPNIKAHTEFVKVLKSRGLQKSQISLISKSRLSLKCLLAGKYYNNFECKLIKFGLDKTLN